MSTRSITHIHEMDSLGSDKIVCSFFRHSDGYPSGHGSDLANWLCSKNLVNGIGSGFKKGWDFNRAGTMAVVLMYELQQETSIEVIRTGGSDFGEDYVYHVNFKDGEFLITCQGLVGEGFTATATKFNGEELEELMNEDE